MAHEVVGDDEVVLTTSRPQLPTWWVGEALVIRQPWQERDPRVPPHRRLDADGRPTVKDLERWVQAQRPVTLGWLAVERKLEGGVVGHCGLLASERLPAGEPEVAFELLRHAWHQSFATEAASAVLEWATRSGYQRVRATVREWNTASRRVLAPVGFMETDQIERDEVYGDTVFITRSL
ncbi:GNAT family N-acetyltransferase [Kineococcus esterisolvens]|uniref:GNAT family N-acetyltransferase n=1 Tax=unclassified Kineococcus TaxID=2621656 RepID=UPI003D7E15A0